MTTHSQVARGQRLTTAMLATLAFVLSCRESDGPATPHLPSEAALAKGGPALSAPSNLTTLAISQTQIDIAWQDNTGRETGYEVHRSTTGVLGSFALHTTVGANVESYSDGGLTAGGQYCYLVRAARASTGAFSEFSNTACATAAAPAIVAFASVAAGGAHTCALTSAGAAYCWGRGESGQLGVPVPASTCMTDAGLSPCSMIPLPVGGGVTFTQLAGGGAHTCGLTSDGTAWCWGNNASGQLGNSSTASQNAPVLVATALKFASIDAGASHTCALTSTGAAHCWGANQRGQLGDGTTTNATVPVAVSGNLTLQLIAAGGFSGGQTCALDTGGQAWCWGANDLGQLGIGTEDLNPHPSPLAVSGGLVFAGITAGLGRHACGVTAAGEGWCWGENSFGALGSRSRKDSAVPVQVAGALAFTQVVAGGFIGHTCGRVSGDAYCWGENEVGQVGDGTTTDRWTPTAVDGGLLFASIDAGFRHSCGHASTGILYCWGSNGAGQLGNNSNAHSTVPSPVFGQP